MPLHATIELRDLRLPCDLGTYGPNDVVPDAHLLDLTLTIDPGLVLIEGDGMDKVFNYDPLVADITRLARDGHYETQEWLITRIIVACARYSQIQRLEAFLRKGPVLPDSGTLGVRLRVGQTELATLRH